MSPLRVRVAVAWPAGVLLVSWGVRVVVVVSPASYLLAAGISVHRVATACPMQTTSAVHMHVHS